MVHPLQRSRQEEQSCAFNLDAKTQFCPDPLKAAVTKCDHGDVVARMGRGLSRSMMGIDGVRKRLREKFRVHGDAALDDREVLELLLSRFRSRTDFELSAKILFDRFGSLGEVLGAPVSTLQNINVVGKSIALDLKMVAAAQQRALKSEIQRRRVLASSAAVLDYCRSVLSYEPREQLRILFLDKRHGLIADELHGQGTVDHIPVYPREVVRRALELSAWAIILIHNHPSGDPTPTLEDIEMTKTIVMATTLMGIIVHDHLVIGGRGVVSMRALGLI
jgi:DNA repair protein RadC